MAKTVKTRIQHKRETATNWASATSFAPMDGELIVYKPDTPGGPAMLKVGDGSAVAKDLPFIKAGSADSAAKDGAGNTITSTYAKNADLTSHTDNTTAHITAAERTKWNNAEKNQNAFSNIKVGSTTVAADTTTDTLELVAGSNVTITPDATNDKVTIAASHPTISTSNDSTSTATPEHGRTFTAVDSITRDSNGHVTKVNTKTVTLPDAGLHYIPSDDFTTIAGSDTTGAYLAAKWSVPNVDSITVPADGMSIAFRTPVAGNKGGILLSIDGGANYYPIIRNNTTLVTTTYAVGSTLILTFNSKQATSPYVTAGTTTSVTGCWQIADYDANTTYTNVKLGHGYGTCSTAAATTAKTVSLSSYTLTTGGIVAIKFTYDVPANATLNINSKGAKAIYYKGAKIPAGVIKAGDIATFIYSSYYHLISIDNSSHIGHTHTVTTANAAPHTHTHDVKVSGTTGSNSGTAVNAVTGYGSFSGGSGSLEAYDAAANGTKKVSNGTRIPFVTSISSTGASASGTATVLTGVKASGTDTFVKTVSGGSGSLKSYDASSGGNVKTSSGRVPYLHNVSHTAASLTGDTTFVKTQGTFTAGTTPVSSAAPTNTSTNSGSAGGATIASYSAGVLTLSNVSAHTHTYDKTTGITLTRGTAPSLGAAITGTVGISGGSISKTTYYLDHTHTGASAGSTASAVTGVASNGTTTAVTGVTGGTTTATTHYLAHTHNAASLGTPSTSSVAPSGHTHSYGSSTALTTGNNSGSAVAAVTSVAASTN